MLFRSLFNGRGNALKDKGELDKAIADYNEALRLDPKYHYAFNGRGTTWMERGDLDKAVADFSESIRVKPNYFLAYANRGEAWRLKGDLDRSIADLDKAIQANPASALFHTYRGDAWRYKGDFDRAFTDFNAALRSQPEFVAAFVGRALTHEKKGDIDKAKADFEKAANLKPTAYFDTTKSAQQTARARLAALTATGTSAPQQTPSREPTVVPASGSRIALVIGNSGYKNVAVLPNPRRDAETIAATLRAVGFQTVELDGDLTRERMMKALRDFAEEADKADWALVYFAGHGIEIGGVNYLVPIDAKLSVDRDAQFEAVPLDQVLGAIDGARKLKLILLDACRENPFAPRQTTATRNVTRGLAPIEPEGPSRGKGATLVVYAAKHGQLALDGASSNSPFVTALVQRLPTPGVEINKIFRLVRDDVLEATSGRQEPFTYGSTPGREDYFFVATH